MFLCHSFHSLRYSTIPVRELVENGARIGAGTLALVDINTVSGIYEFYKECLTHRVKPVVGMDVRVDGEQLYTCLAKNPDGLAEVNRMMTAHNCDGQEIPRQNPDLREVFIIYPLQNIPERLGENEFIGIRPDEANILVQREWKQKIRKMVVLQPVVFQSKREYNLHRILRAIDRNTLVSKLEEGDVCRKSECMKPVFDVLKHFRNYPQIIENTEKIFTECSFDFDFSTPKNKKYFTKSKESDEKLLRKLACEGFKNRYSEDNLAARNRVEKELKVIDELNFSGYFLITWDIVQYSNSRGFMHVGRGSGANSIVSYCLGITDICPLELDLYFERFLNLNRKTPPDFDIDWSWKERDEILKYIFEKYGRDHVAFCGTNVEFKYRSIFREVGKAFGLPKEELDALAKNPVETHDDNKVVKLVQKYGKLLEKFPNQRSMHSCGILISEEPITTYSALEMPPKGFAIVQFDMHTTEEIGLEKFDILSQRGLGTIDEAVKLIKKNQGIEVDIRDTRLSLNEKTCNEYLSKGKTLGCFYIESPAMRGLLRRLKCENYKTLVAASSIIRPGVAQSGMMREYIFRHNNPDQFEYFHKVFEEQLGETYGIMVYQEDVIKIALHYGGVSAEDGDILRRAMSGKGRSLEALQKVKNHFFECARKNGHPKIFQRKCTARLKVLRDILSARRIPRATPWKVIRVCT